MYKFKLTSIEKIVFSTAGVNGKIEADRYTIKRILDDKFTFHYLPDLQILDKQPLKTHFYVLQKNKKKKP